MFSTGEKISTQLNLKFNEIPIEEFTSDKFLIAPEVKEIGEQLISLLRKDLSGWNIAYVFKRTSTKSKDGVILGTAKKENDLSRVLHGFDGVVTIAFDTWVTMDKDQKARLVYHELMHFAPNTEKGVLEIQDHPIQEFPEVIKIFGPGDDKDISFIESYEHFKKYNSTLIDEINNEIKFKKQLES